MARFTGMTIRTEAVYLRVEYEYPPTDAQIRRGASPVPASLREVVAQLEELQRFLSTVGLLAAEGRPAWWAGPLASEAGMEEGETRIVVGVSGSFDWPDTPRVLRMSLASPLVVIVALAATPALPRTLKALVELAAVAWNLPVQIRRDKAKFEAETAQEVLKKAQAEAELRTLGALVHQSGDVARPKSLQVWTNEADDTDLDELVRAHR
jgi:hypothetical protein